MIDIISTLFIREDNTASQYSSQSSQSQTFQNLYANPTYLLPTQNVIITAKLGSVKVVESYSINGSELVPVHCQNVLGPESGERNTNRPNSLKHPYV